MHCRELIKLILAIVVGKARGHHFIRVHEAVQWSPLLLNWVIPMVLFKSILDEEIWKLLGFCLHVLIGSSPSSPGSSNASLERHF